MSYVTLYNVSVNGGVIFTISGTKVDYVWKNLTNYKPIPGKFGISEVDNAGFENPKITLSGVIDSNADSTTLGILKGFAKLQFDGTSATAVKVAMASGESDYLIQDASDTNNYLYCVIESFNFGFDTTVREGAKILYQIFLRETETELS